jgi:hypothetical protein
MMQTKPSLILMTKMEIATFFHKTLSPTMTPV